MRSLSCRPPLFMGNSDAPLLAPSSPPTPVPLIFLIGLPGSGKSTWVQQFSRRHPGYGWVSTDQIRADLYGDEAVQGDWRAVWGRVQQQWQQGIDAIRAGQLQGVIYDATNARRRNRRDAIATARHLGFTQITAYWFDVPLAVCLARNRLRSRHVPDEVICRMHRQLMGAPPSLAEDLDGLVRLPWSASMGS